MLFACVPGLGTQPRPEWIALNVQAATNPQVPQSCAKVQGVHEVVLVKFWVACFNAQFGRGQWSCKTSTVSMFNGGLYGQSVDDHTELALILH